MRHLGRTHKVSVAWLHEQYSGDSMDTSYCDSSLQCADIFTKAFTDKIRWGPVCKLIAHFKPGDLDFIATTHKATPATSRAAQRGGNRDANSRQNESSDPPKKGMFSIPRRCIEWCSRRDSIIGQESPESANCDTIRITEKEDASSSSGLEFTKAALAGRNDTRIPKKKLRSIVLSASPCTGDRHGSSLT